MQQLLKAIEKNPNNTKCISANTPQTDEIRRLTSNELVWGGRAVVLNQHV